MTAQLQAPCLLVVVGVRQGAQGRQAGGGGAAPTCPRRLVACLQVQTIDLPVTGSSGAKAGAAPGRAAGAAAAPAAAAKPPSGPLVTVGISVGAEGRVEVAVSVASPPAPPAAAPASAPRAVSPAPGGVTRLGSVNRAMNLGSFTAGVTRIGGGFGAGAGRGVGGRGPGSVAALLGSVGLGPAAGGAAAAEEAEAAAPRKARTHKKVGGGVGRVVGCVCRVGAV